MSTIINSVAELRPSEITHYRGGGGQQNEPVNITLLTILGTKYIKCTVQQAAERKIVKTFCRQSPGISKICLSGGMLRSSARKRRTRMRSESVSKSPCVTTTTGLSSEAQVMEN